MTIATGAEPAISTSDVPERPAEAVRRGARPRRTTAALIALSAIVAVVAAGLLVGWRHSAGQADGLRQQATLRATALSAAQAYAVDLTTYDYTKLAAQQSKLAGESTSSFQKTFADSMKSLGPIFRQLHATATGKVVDAAVVSASDKSAVVIAFVDQTANSAKMAKPEAQSSRVRMTLVRTAGSWLLDRVDLV